MLKKLSTIVLLSLALMIMLGHDIIGHTHRHDHHAGHQSHHHHHHPVDDDGQGKPLDFRFLFSQFQHAASGLIYLSSHANGSGLTRELPLDFDGMCCFQFIQVPRTYRVLKQPPEDNHAQNLTYFFSSGLRAPPHFLA